MSGVILISIVRRAWVSLSQAWLAPCTATADADLEPTAGFTVTEAHCNDQAVLELPALAAGFYSLSLWCGHAWRYASPIGDVTPRVVFEVRTARVRGSIPELPAPRVVAVSSIALRVMWWREPNWGAS